jgi:protein gp37
MAHRLAGRVGYDANEPFRVTLRPERLGVPLAWKRPRRVFVCSMGDLFHSAVPERYIKRVFGTMKQADRHSFQVLTKRPSRLALLSGELEWSPNIWAGTTVESDEYLWRIDSLRSTGAHVKFLSLEPLLGPLPGLDLHGIDWTIVGGETGPGARPMHPDWVRDIRDQCQEAGVAFFFKQWGGVNKKRAGRILDGRTWDEMPEVAR